MYFLYQVNSINKEINFTKLIEIILKYRKSKLEIKDYFKNNELDFVKSSVSAKYFFTILEKFNILKLTNLKNLKNQTILSPVRRGSTSVNINFFELCSENINLIDSMLSKYSIFKEVRKSELPSKLVSEIYNFIDKNIYDAIGEIYERDYSLVYNIYDYSINPNKCYDFEIKVNEAINMFYNVESEVVSGAGEPDFVARFKPNFPSLNNSKIFTGDTKSTKNKLMSINPGRLKQHMRKYKSDYTILITPKYTPSAKKDISGEKIVILSSLALSEVIKNFIKYDDKPSFKEFDEIIINNLGSDISDKFYKKASDIYGISYK